MTVFHLHMFVPGITPVYTGYVSRSVWTNFWDQSEVGERASPANRFCRDAHAVICVIRGFRVSVLSITFKSGPFPGAGRDRVITRVPHRVQITSIPKVPPILLLSGGRRDRIR